MFEVNAYLEVPGCPTVQTAHYAWVIEYTRKNGEIETREGFRRITGSANAMAIQGLIEILGNLKPGCHVTLLTNSTHVFAALENNWPQMWERNHWENTMGKPVKNADLWKQAAELMKKFEVTGKLAQRHPYRSWMKTEMKRRDRSAFPEKIETEKAQKAQ